MADARYKIFFSHKHRDASVTKEIIEILHKNTENVRCFISEEIKKGTDWRAEIAKALKGSTFLVLVFTDPKEDWDWCFYETGFFDALNQVREGTEARKIYCLHHPSTPRPPPLENLQSIPATPGEISSWLEGVFALTQQPRKESGDDFPTMAAKICALFPESRRSLYVEKSIEIVITRSSLNSVDDLANDTMISGEMGLMQEVFGTNTGEINWQQTKERFDTFPNSRAVNLRTLTEISRALYSIYRNNWRRPIQGMVFVGDGPKRYRPVIDHAEEVSGGKINCRIVLVEEVGGPLQNVDKPLGALLTAMRMAVRIRWEIVNPFSSEVRFLSRRNPKELRANLQTCLNNIFSEMEFRGTYSLSHLKSSFDKDANKIKMQEILDQADPIFEKIWHGIGFPDTAETFGEAPTEQFDEKSLTLLEDGLAELEKINSEFLKMSAERAQALIRKELRKTKGVSKRTGGPAAPTAGAPLESSRQSIVQGLRATS